MKLLFIRHAHPDYRLDSLTEKGWREAGYLAKKLEQMKIDEFYVSPYGRALDTASVTMKKIGRNAIECEWLQEYGNPAPRFRSKDYKEWNAWDKLAGTWENDERFFRYDEWYLNETYAEKGMKEEYHRVIKHFDELLAIHGYEREGHFYKVKEGNNKVLAFFCHFGITAVLLSHLLNVSPMLLWHGTCALPSSITTVVTDERQKGTAMFRMTSFGELSHLELNGELPAKTGLKIEFYKKEQGDET